MLYAYLRSSKLKLKINLKRKPKFVRSDCKGAYYKKYDEGGQFMGRFVIAYMNARRGPILNAWHTRIK